MTADIARYLAGALGLLVAGTLVVLLDIELDNFDVVADGVGYVLIAVAAFRISHAAEEAGGSPARSAGLGTGVVAVLLALTWLANVVTGGEWNAGTGGWIVSVLGLAALVCGIWLLLTLSQWVAALGMTPESRRLQTAAVALGVAWGLLSAFLWVAGIMLFEARGETGLLAFGTLLLGAFLVAG